MKTTDKEGRSCRGFLVHVYSKAGRGDKERCVTYGIGKIMEPLCIDEAVKVCKTAISRGLRVAVETDGSGGKEFMGGQELIDLAEWVEPAGMDLGDERKSAADLEKAERARKLKELQARRLFAPDLDTQADMIDLLKAENPLLAFRF